MVDMVVNINQKSKIPQVLTLLILMTTVNLVNKTGGIYGMQMFSKCALNDEMVASSCLQLLPQAAKVNQMQILMA